MKDSVSLLTGLPLSQLWECEQVTSPPEPPQMVVRSKREGTSLTPGASTWASCEDIIPLPTVGSREGSPWAGQGWVGRFPLTSFSWCLSLSLGFSAEVGGVVTSDTLSP